MDTRQYSWSNASDGAAHGQPPEAAAAGAASPRPVIRGESSLAIHIDWAAFTVRGPTVLELKDSVEAWVQRPVVMAQGSKGWNGYQHHARLYVPDVREEKLQLRGIGLIAWGGDSQKGKTYASLTGAGASLVAEWQNVEQGLKDWGAGLTRLDIAGDDLEGRWSVDTAKALYLGSGFSSGGRKPSHNVHGDWLQITGSGRTLEVGKRQHGKMLRIYEKGRQLGDAQSPWVRWELQLGNRDREIPLDALSNPLPYFAGAYGCMGELTGVLGERVKIERHIRTLSLKHLTKHCRRSYGKLIDALLVEHLGDYAAVVEELRRPGLPSRLVVNDIPFSAEQVVA